MQTLLTSTCHEIKVPTGIDELPAWRRSFFTRYQIEALEMDTTPEAFATRVIGPIMQANQEGKTADVSTYLQNLYFSMQAMKEGYSPDALLFGTILLEVDGQPVTDCTPEGLEPLLRVLACPIDEYSRIVEDVKKNSSSAETAISLGLLSLTE